MNSKQEEKISIFCKIVQENNKLGTIAEATKKKIDGFDIGLGKGGDVMIRRDSTYGSCNMIPADAVIAVRDFLIKITKEEE